MLHLHLDCNDPADLIRRLDQVGVGKVSVAGGGAVAAVTEQLAC